MKFMRGHWLLRGFLMSMFKNLFLVAGNTSFKLAPAWVYLERYLDHNQQ